MPKDMGHAIQDHARLDELAQLKLLDTPPEEAFDRLTRLAARVVGAPVVLVSLVDDHRQFFKSAFGLHEPWASRRETPLSHSFCKYVVATAMALVVDDARLSQMLRNNGAITELGVIAYLGIPLKTPKGATIGSFCAIGSTPRKWTRAEQQTMEDLAQCVMSEIALRVASREMRTIQQGLKREAAEHDIAVRALQANGLRHTVMQQLEAALTFVETQRHEPVVAELPPFNTTTGSSTAVHELYLEQLRAKLTTRQCDVFDLLIAGLQTKEIARRLKRSPRTIEVHRAMILKRLELQSFGQLLKHLLAGAGRHRASTHVRDDGTATRP